MARWGVLLLLLTGWCSFVAASVVIPAGTVLSLTGSSCPAGFTAYSASAGRVILGTGTLGAHTYALGDTGGSAFHTLTTAEIPSHSHGYNMAAWGGSVLVAGGSFTSFYHTHTGATSGSAGGGSPHENRQPYIALTRCVLDADFDGGAGMTAELFVWAVVLLAFAAGVIAGQQR